MTILLILIPLMVALLLPSFVRDAQVKGYRDAAKLLRRETCQD